MSLGVWVALPNQKWGNTCPSPGSYGPVVIVVVIVVVIIIIITTIFYYYYYKANMCYITFENTPVGLFSKEV